MARTFTKGVFLSKQPFVDFTSSTIGGYTLPMMNTDTFATKLGRKKMAEALGILPTAVSNAVVRGSFPPAWFNVCEAMARGHGIECPPELFNQRQLHNSPSSTASSGPASPDGLLPVDNLECGKSDFKETLPKEQAPA